MPLGEKEGWEESLSKFCGLETDFSDDVPSLLTHNIDNGRFDFVLAPLMNPSYRPSLVDESNSDSHVLPFAGSDLVVPPIRWLLHVIGKISSWIDLDSQNETLRMDSETTLKQEISWAKHLNLRACLLPTPKGPSCANYARCVNQILQGKNEMQLWLRIPLRKPHGRNDSWEIWNSFRLLCDHDRKLSVALDVTMQPSQNSIDRWLGEPVKAAIISTECFLNALGHTYLLDEELITSFFHHSVQVIISGRPLHVVPQSMVTHPHKPYLDYVSRLFLSMKPLAERERIECSVRDSLYSPLQPLENNPDAETYDSFEIDSVKYIQYQRAIAKALKDMPAPNVKGSELPTVLMVVGAGRGPLVRTSLQAAEEAGRKLKVYAVEKNPNAVVTLHELVKTNGWEDIVTVISCDMRFWNAPEKADIVVSDLLGSFGDNELSPECLGGAERFLKPDGISIPSSYTSFIQPITTSKLYNDVKDHDDLSYFEIGYSVKLHKCHRLAPSQRVFTFTHPDFSTKPNNQCYKKLRFDLPSDMGSALVHGFAGYFEAVLYDDVSISIEPTRATPNMFGWLPMFFPLRKPVKVDSNSPIEAHFWRCGDSKKVWYEWSVSLPTVTPIQNTNGSSYWISL